MDVFVIEEVLKSCGRPMEIHVVADGAEAVARFRQFEPALVLLDLNIPKVPGLEVLAEIRKHPRLGQVPVVIVTSSDSKKDYRAAENLGANAYFCKPSNLIDFMNLAEVVGPLLPSAGKIS